LSVFIHNPPVIQFVIKNTGLWPAMIWKMNKKPIVKIYIDGANVFYTQKKLGRSLDWKKVKDYLSQDRDVIEYRYYLGIKKGDEAVKKYLKYLDQINFVAVSKPIKVIQVDGQHPLNKLYEYGQIYKCNFDVEIATDISFDRAVLDEVILFSGDSDFKYLSEKIKNTGKKFTVFASRKTIAWELRLSASEHFFIEDIPEIFRE